MMKSGDQQRDTGFVAFVSYAHRDQRWAEWVHHALETYRLPRTLAAGRGTRRIGRLFLDRSELATSNSLSDRIEEALIGSTNLVLVCSPSARASRWVNEEVRRFRAMGRTDRIFCLIVDGDPARHDEGGCFPPALLENEAGELVHEPLAADVRPGKDRRGDARLKLVAGLLDLPLDALRRRETARRQRVLVSIAAVSFVLLAVMTVLTTVALFSRAEAVHQKNLALAARAEAIRQRDTAERTATFLRDVFDQADPTRSDGKEATLRSVVDGAAARALGSQELASEPEVKANLLAVLANVYANMQLVGQGRRLVDAARALHANDPQARMTIVSVDARLRLWEGDYVGLRHTLDEGFRLLARHPVLSPYRPPLLAYRAQLGQALGDNAAAVRDAVELRRLSLAAVPPDRDNELLSLLIEGIAAVDDNAPERGAPLLRRVIAAREAMGQPLNPQVLTATNTLGAVAIKQGRPVEAEAWFRKAEQLQRRVFGEESLDVALSRSNLGRALVEQRRFDEAVSVLESARSAFVAQASDRVDTLANLEDSLGLARSGQGDFAGARAAFDHGLTVARSNAMPKEIELLTDLAELDCRTRQFDHGERGIEAARAALARFALKEPWRSARIDSVAAGCLVAQGKIAAARPLSERSLGPVTARWGEYSLFGSSAIQQARRSGGGRPQAR